MSNEPRVQVHAVSRMSTQSHRTMTSSEEESEEEVHRIELSEPLEKNGKHLRVLDGPRKGALLYTRITVRDSMRVLLV